MNTYFLIIIFLYLAEYILSFKYPIIKHNFNHSRNTYRFKTQLLNLIPYYIPTIHLCIGNPQQCFHLALDTSSYHTFLSSPPDSESKTIFKKHYIIQDDNKIKDPPVTVSFQNNILYGKQLSEVIAFDQSFIPKAEMRIILIYNEVDITPLPFDGYLGLTYKYSQEALKKQSFFDLLPLSRKQFAISLNKNFNGHFYIDNEFDIEHIENKCHPDLSKVVSNWYCNLSMIAIGEETIKINKLAFFLSSDHHITFPLQFSGFFKTQLYKESKGLCDYDDSKRILYCDKTAQVKDFKPLEMVFGNKGRLRVYWTEIFQLVNNPDSGTDIYVSRLIFLQDGYLIVEVGIPAFINHIMIFDKDSNSIGFLTIDNTLINEHSLIDWTIIGYLVTIALCIVGVSIISYIKLRVLIA